MPIALGGMSAANPLGQSGVVTDRAKNLEFWPRGSLSRRRGFQPYVNGVPTASALYDMFLYDRYVSDVRTVDLVARSASGSLWHTQVFSNVTESTANGWATLSTGAWETATDGGQGFVREDTCLYSDGSRARVWTTTAAYTTLGLAAPTGTPGWNLVVTPSRTEPGYYEYTFESYNEARNARSLPCGFTAPSTLELTSGATNALTRYYTLGLNPGLAYTMAVGIAGLTVDANGEKINVYRRHPYDSSYRPARRMDDVRQVASVGTASTVLLDKLNDLELGDRLTYAASTPTPWKAAAKYGDRYWYVPATDPWKIWFTEVDAPENVAKKVTVAGVPITPILDGNQDIPWLGESWVAVDREAGPVMTVKSFGGMLAILTESQTWRLVGTGPGSFDLHCVEPTIGWAARRAVVLTPFGLLGMSQQGIIWWRGGKPQVVSKGWLDFDDSASPVALARASIKNAVACYDPVHEQVEFAVTKLGSSGNDLIICLDLGISTPSNPVFTYHTPALASGETITSMVLLSLPTREPCIVYGTSAGRTLYRTGATDNNATTSAGVPWEWSGWLGQRNTQTSKTNLGVKLTQNCAYSATVSASLWVLDTARRPASGAEPTEEGTFPCGPSTYGGWESGAGGVLAYVRLTETGSTAFEIQEIAPYSYPQEDFRSSEP